MYRRVAKALFTYIPNIARTTILRASPVFFDYFEMKPTSCNIILTNRCNLRCVMCRQWRTPPGNELDTIQWKNVIGDLRDSGIRNIHFTGGEPLLRPDIGELVRYSEGLGMTVGLTTNGSMLSTSMLEELIDAGIRSIAISIDAIGGEYEKIRGAPGSFEMVRKAAVDLSVKRRERGVDAYINFTLMRQNVSSLPRVKEFADKIGLPLAICLLDKTSSIFSVKENADTFWLDPVKDKEALLAAAGYLKAEIARKPDSVILNYPAVEYIVEYFKDPRQARIPCAISQDRIFVDPFGNVMGGCLSMGLMGNLITGRFKALVRDKKYRLAKKRMFYKKCSGCSCGYLYNLRHMPEMILKDVRERVGI